MALVTYDLDTMQNAATQLEQYIEEWKSKVDELYTNYEELDDMWDGDANDTFTAKFVGEDKEKYAQLSTVLQEYQNALNTAVQTYIAAEEEAKSTLSSH